jgi:2-polyprenyl-3-methyl-5-hydroxy-6-metoxy-1,4-benzoquinol methylase
MADQATGLLSGWLRGARIRAVVPHLRGSVLDVGCGVGTLAEFVAPNAYRGFDVDVESVRDASARYPEHHFSVDLPTGRRFTSIAALAVIEHVASPVLFLSSLRDLLEPGGSILLTTPHPNGEWIHRAGALMGLFSRSAAEEHHALLDPVALDRHARNANLEVVRRESFLLGLNQLFILRQS